MNEIGEELNNKEVKKAGKSYLEQVAADAEEYVNECMKNAEEYISW